MLGWKVTMAETTCSAMATAADGRSGLFNGMSGPAILADKVSTAMNDDQDTVRM